MASNISFKPFQEGDDINCFLERMEQHFTANQINEARQLPTLLISLHQDVYKILKSMVHPFLPKEKSYREIEEVLKLRFQPRVAHFRKRIKFYNLRQAEGESSSKWFARVKEAATECNFGKGIEEYVKDKFITGMLPGPVQDRLCEEPVTKDTQDLLEIALNKESSFQQSDLVSVNKISNKFNSKQSSAQVKIKTFNKQGCDKSPQGNILKCVHCGKPNHSFARCKYKSYKCKICNKIGHLALVCKNKPTNNINIENNSVDIFTVKHESHINYISPFMIKCYVNSIPLDMELDTGATVSCIPYKIYKEKFCNVKLNHTALELKTYSGQLVKPSGEISVNLKLNGKEVHCSLLVVENGCRNLFGRDLMNLFDMDMKELIGLNSVSVSNLESILQEYSDVFKNELGVIKGEEICLELKENTKPIFMKHRPIPFSFKEKVDQELTKLEKEGVISKVDNSDWGTPLVPVIKENGQLRLCANYKITVNKYLKEFNHPIPRIEDIFTALQGGEKFSRLDLRNAFNHLILNEATGKLLAWSTPRGIYKLHRLPYGTKPASAIFQAKLEKILLGAKGVVNFIDDVVVTGNNDLEHLQNLKEVLKRFKEAGIRLNKDKCTFFQKDIKYLGHIISEKGLSKDMSKVNSIIKAPAPTNVSEARAWLGMVNYYGKFIKNLSIKLKPIYNLLQKNIKFNWTKECQKSFDTIKKDIISDNVLINYSRDLPLRLACDASQNGIGAVLSHILPDGTERPISFISRVYTKAEKGYSMIHKEALAIYWAVQKLYQYLIGRKFELLSDHKPLLALFGEHKSLPQMAAGRLQRWSLYLSSFDYTFKHIKGIENVKADCMSRLPLQSTVLNSNNQECDYINFIEDQNIIDINLIRSETRKDPILSSVYNMIRYGFPKHMKNEAFKPFINRKSELYIESGVIMWGYRIVIPKKLQNNLLKELHVSHEGIVKMKNNARSYFWFPNLDNSIENFVKSCQVCMSARPEPQKSKIISWPRTNFPYERVHADFLGPIKGKMILLIVDCYTKWPEAFIMKNLDCNTTVEKFRECFSRFGLPKVVVTDNAATFCSKEFSEFLFKNGIQHETSPPFHPATNGFAENAVKNFKNSMYKSLSDVKNRNVSFETLMCRYLFHYRNSIHCFTNVSPAEAMFNRKLRSRLDLLSTKKEINQKITVGKREEKFKEGDYVYCRDYRNPNKKKFVKCIIDEVLGQRTYLCKVLGENLIWKRHLDQIIRSLSQNQKEHVSETGKNILNDNVINDSHESIYNNYDKNGSDNSDTIVIDPVSEVTDNICNNSNIASEIVTNQNEEVACASNSFESSHSSQILRRSERQRRAPQRLNL